MFNITLVSQEARAAHFNVPIETSQPDYSASVAPLPDGTLNLCMRHGVTSLAWSPLAGGRMVMGQKVQPTLLAVINQLAAASSPSQPLSRPEIYRIVVASEGRQLS